MPSSKQKHLPPDIALAKILQTRCLLNQPLHLCRYIQYYVGFEVPTRQFVAHASHNRDRPRVQSFRLCLVVFFCYMGSRKKTKTKTNKNRAYVSKSLILLFLASHVKRERDYVPIETKSLSVRITFRLAGNLRSSSSAASSRLNLLTGRPRSSVENHVKARKIHYE